MKQKLIHFGFKCSLLVLGKEQIGGFWLFRLVALVANMLGRFVDSDILRRSELDIGIKGKRWTA